MSSAPSSALSAEIQKRRTFAIISHPDAGKTTLTEKLLLFGGSIREAGAVKSNKIDRSATSDFMEIERQRGISVATSVMSFEYRNVLINILDTPGHKDFAEDTFRTLTAVDSVILVVDSVKGVEEQTERLMEVCRMRSTPVIVFINKMDREGLPSLELMDIIEDKLSIRVRPVTWPINQGSRFKGVYHLGQQSLQIFRPGATTLHEDDGVLIEGLDPGALEPHIGSVDAAQLVEDVELIETVYGDLELDEYRKGNLAPVFFGSALNNFGVQELLNTFLDMAPPPLPRYSDTREVLPEEQKFSGFVFKIHANLDPKHRDRIAFLRVCSGTFQRGVMYQHVRLGKKLRFNNPYSFMAARKDVVDQAFPGDVLGLYDRGDLKIGDTLTEGEQFHFKGIPSFSPEQFRELVNADPLRSKQFEKGVQQLTEEGLAQLFIQDQGRRKIVGTVGNLQFDVIQYRLQHEYGADCRFTSLPFYRAIWITSDNQSALRKFEEYYQRRIATDRDGATVFFAEGQWELNYVQRENPDIAFHFTSEFKLEENKYA